MPNPRDFSQKQRPPILPIMAVNGPLEMRREHGKLASSAAMLFQQVFRSDLTAESRNLQNKAVLKRFDA